MVQGNHGEGWFRMRHEEAAAGLMRKTLSAVLVRSAGFIHISSVLFQSRTVPLRGAFRRRPIVATLSVLLCAGLVGGLGACGEEREVGGPQEGALPFEAPSPSLSRLTEAQYMNSLQDLVGPEVVLSTDVDPDVRSSGFFSIAARETSLSRFGVQQAESAAFDAVQQALANADARARLVSCEPSGADDRACMEEVVQAFARRAWRRTVALEEVAALVAVGLAAAGQYERFDAGVEFALAGVLQSPYFLYRVELGEDSGDGARRFDGFELASRLSYFLWNTTPDDALLNAAEAGELQTEEGYADQVNRLLDAPRARQGLRAFFSQLYELDHLDGLTKDPELFTHFSPELGAEAREETLRLIEHWAFDEPQDFRELFRTPTTFLSRKLAAIYNVRAPREDWGRYEFSDSDRRRGLLGHVSFLALHSHPRGTSATLRGMFVRRILLCENVPAPPVDVDTSLPEPSGMTLTLRDRVQEHLSNPSCAGCHRSLDMIGLSFENYDGIGA